MIVYDITGFQRHGFCELSQYIGKFKIFKINDVSMRTVIFYQRNLFTIFFVCIILLMGCDRQPIKEKQVNVVFRYDDYNALGPTDAELRIIGAFRKNEPSESSRLLLLIPLKIHLLKILFLSQERKLIF